jgi:uncharacterized protein
MDDKTSDVSGRTLPFNNLFLNSGFVHGLNLWPIYFLTIALTLFCYFFAPSITLIHLVILAKQNGMTLEQILANPDVLQDSVATGIDMNYILISLFGIFVLAFLGLWFGLKKFHHKTLTSVITGYEKFRTKRFWFAFAIWSLIVLLTVAIEYAMNPGEFELVFQPQGFIIGLILMLLFMPIQTGFEEIFFRGYLVQGLSQVFKNGIVPVLITSLLFGAAHMDNPEVDKYGWQMMLPYYSGFGLFLGALALLDEGLELSFGIHLANNLISSLLVTSKESVLKTYSVFEVKSEEPVAEIILTLVMIVLASGIFWYKYRWKNFNLIIK